VILSPATIMTFRPESPCIVNLPSTKLCHYTSR